MRVGVEGAAKSLHLPRLHALQVTPAGVSVEGDFAHCQLAELWWQLVTDGCVGLTILFTVGYEKSGTLKRHLIIYKSLFYKPLTYLQ